jgi:hypothetical protein
MAMRKWARSVGFATRATLGRAGRCQDRGLAMREVGQEARSSKTRGRKKTSTTRVALILAKAKRRPWRRESVPCPRQSAQQESSNKGRWRAGEGQAEEL